MTENILTPWNILVKKSESYSKLSKPEILAVLDILKENGESTITAVYNIFIKNYQDDATQRQIRYILSLMEENELITKNSDGYSLNNPEIATFKSPISIYESILLTLSFIPVLITWDISAFGLFIGIVLCISLHQVEYTLSQRKKPKIDRLIDKIIK